MFLISTKLSSRYKHLDAKTPTLAENKKEESMLELQSPIHKIEVVKGARINIDKFRRKKNKESLLQK